MVFPRARMEPRRQMDQESAVMGGKPRMKGLTIFTLHAVIAKILF